MTTKRRASLTGSWSGAFRYPRDAFPETVFNAQIEESDGAFTGSIQEPNFARSGPGVLNSDIEGARSGRAITFTKFYDEQAAFNFAIRYEGEADDALMRIEGRWTNPDWSGPFFMVRDDEDEASEAAEMADAVGGTRD